VVLADWELIWEERYARTAAEDNPTLARPDAGERGAEQGYASADPAESLARFRERRAALTASLRALPDPAWERAAHLERIGDLSLGGLVALALGHDAYHLRQTAEYLAAAGSKDAQGRA
ncbi:MAG TPA: DinB family protein, partial [Armatimonadaceae bacterium]|nr:DinB family protein [Armatimonadaceae bacterium]